MPLTLLFQNFADGAAFSDGLWTAELPLLNVQNGDVKKVARSVSAAAVATRITVNLGRGRPVAGIAFGPTNLSPGATYRVAAYATMAAAVPAWQSAIQTVEGSTVPSLSLPWEASGWWYGRDTLDDTPEPLWACVLVPKADRGAVLNAPVWRITIDDPGNRDGYVQIGRLLIARAYEPSINYAYGAGLSFEPLTTRSESLSGTRYDSHRGLRRRFRGVIDSLPEDEAFAQVYRVATTLRTDRQVFVVPDPDDVANFQKRSFLGTFAEVPGIEQVSFQRAGTAFDIEEVI